MAHQTFQGTFLSHVIYIATYLNQATQVKTNIFGKSLKLLGQPEAQPTALQDQ